MTLTETLAPKSPPLRQDVDGVVRVGNTRVTLDTVVEAYKQGMSAAEIADAYDSLTLAQVHAVLSYYLDHREQVGAYMRARDEAAVELYKRIDAASPWPEFRERLLKRRDARQQEPQ